MTGINFIFNKIKFLIVGILDLIRYLCCSSRSRKKSVADFAPLTSIGIVGKDDSLVINNEDMNFVAASSSNFNQPRNVQDYITQYRQQKCKQLTNESTDEASSDFFEDMQPKIVRQQKLLLKTNEEPPSMPRNSRLSCTTDVKASELSAWEEMESTGNWDIDEETTNELLKEKRRIELNMEDVDCPVCSRPINAKDIERHVNSCLFLNSSNDEIPSRKRKENIVSPRPTKVSKSGGSSVPQNAVAQQEVSVSSRESKSSELLSTLPASNSMSKEVVKREYSFEIPLAEALRPSILTDFVGQEQAVGSGSVLRKLLDKADIPSLILWGPPGCGKTTLANVIKEILNQHGKKFGTPVRFVKLHATMAGVGDVKEVINIAKNEFRMFNKKTILFMDEIHRFNKLQQDTFLPHVENGTITLIGATTENPSFSLNNALLSRCRVILLDKLSSENIKKILYRAVEFLGGQVTSSNSKNEIEESAKWMIDHESIDWLAEISDGDARIALNSLQMAVQSKSDSESCDLITLDDIKDGIKKSHILYDKKGEEHYNLISAVHKSIRASDDNAALYWVNRMLLGGEDPLFIARRLVRAAGEDIGLADPNALVLAVSTMHGCQQIGMPECDVLLSELAVYLARCPKSTEVYKAMNRVKAHIAEQKGPMPAVPLHLRNAPTKLMKNLGYGKGYNVLDKGSSGLEYMPEGLEHMNFFKEEI
ncbi:hypothetical protein V9T40_006570 [Parthenolecanium corni]|uniref:UBZ4-type domain-containing protein n=1 Tax=Parthenolecanium corni TaxID=536013 RepID=A0AAN9TXY1_9HEMI